MLGAAVAALGVGLPLPQVDGAGRRGRAGSSSSSAAGAIGGADVSSVGKRGPT